MPCDLSIEHSPWDRTVAMDRSACVYLEPMRPAVAFQEPVFERDRDYDPCPFICASRPQPRSERRNRLFRRATW